MKNILFISLTLLFFGCKAQQPAKNNQNSLQEPIKPKLVVGIVVDQMRYEYLYRYADRYTENGFKRLMGEGFNCRNHQYHYASTVTGPGHAHVYTGSVPAISGIVGNSWYNKQDGTVEYVVSDTTQSTVGEGSASTGQMSPENLKVTTISDQLRIANQYRSKVVGVAIKDRGAILPAGHTGSAYWYDAGKGNWVTSTYYAKELPSWVNAYNSLKKADAYAAQPWNTLYDLSTYTQSEEDDQPYESTLSGETKAAFPHTFSKREIATTPFGNTITLDIALEALKNEELGKDDITDLLAISFSSPDYVGHYFGPQSVELEDVYLRLDREIERLLNTLDQEVGKGNYTVFLTADHAVAEIPAYAKKHNLPAGLFTGNEIQKKANDILSAKYGENKWIISQENYELYLNKPLLAEKNLSVEQVKNTIKNEMILMDGIYNVINLSEVGSESIPTFYKEKLLNIYNPKRSGEVMVLIEPGWMSGYTKGTTHGSMYAYDTHVPMLWYGCGIPKGETTRTTYIADIAPTVAELLHILEPSGSVGEPIQEILEP